MLARLRIGTKLLLAPAVALLLLVSLACGAWYVLVRQNAMFEEVVGRRAAQVRAANELVIEAQRTHAAVYQLHAWMGGGFPRHRIDALGASILRQHGLSSARIERLAHATRGGAERRHVEGAAAAHRRYVGAVRDVLELAREDQSMGANAMVRADGAFADVAERMHALALLEQRLAQQAFSSAAAHFRAIAILTPCVIVLAIVFSLRISMVVRRALLADIRAIEATATGLASGDLTAGARLDGKDEIAETARVLHASIGSLNATLRTVFESARAIGAASRDLALGNLNLTTRAGFRASALAHTTSSVQDLAATVTLTADGVEAANRLAASASHVARQGADVVGHLVATLATVRDSTRQVGAIGARLDALADTAGTPAANAALAAAARELAALAGGAIAAIDGGTAWAAQAGASMATLAGSAQQVGDIMGRISSASAEQANGLADVNEAILRMDQVTQRNAALVDEAAEAARTLQTQALVLSRAVAMFRLDEAVQDAAPAAPSNLADPDLRALLRDGRRDASLPGPGERTKAGRGHLRLAASRE